MIDIDRRSDQFEAVGAFLRDVPADVWLLSVYAIGALLVDPWIEGSVARLVVFAPLLLFVPGYVLTTVLCPTAPKGRNDRPSTPLAQGDPNGSAGRWSTTLDGPERAALSIGMSVTLLPIFGLFLAIGTGGLAEFLLPTVVLFSLVVGTIGAIRRALLSRDRRFVVPIGSWYRTALAGVRDVPRPTAALNVALVVCIVVAIGALSFGLAAPPEGTETTTVLLGTEDNETFLAGDYPTQIASADSPEYALLVENTEGVPAEYTIVVQLQNVSDGDVVESSELDRFDLQVDDGETTIESHEISPETTGESLRLAYLVYRGEPPAEPTSSSADRTVHVWIDVHD